MVKKNAKRQREAVAQETEKKKPKLSKALKKLRREFKQHREEWRKNKDDKKLRKIFKRAKKAFQDLKDKEAAETTESTPEKKEHKEASQQPQVVESEAKEVVVVDDRQANLERAKAAWTADRSNKELRAAFLAAKQAAKAPLPAAKTAATSTSNGSDPSGPVSKVFCSNVADDVDDEKIQTHFESCGTILDTYWLYDKKTGAFRGSGFVTFDSPEAAAKAVTISGQVYGDKELTVALARPMASWNGAMKSGKGRRVYCGNLDVSITREHLNEFFADCGAIEKVEWREDDNGEFKGCAFLTFTTVKGAAKAWKLSGEILNGCEVEVQPRRAGGNNGGDDEKRGMKVLPLGDKPAGCTTCFVGNLPYDMDESVFTEFAGGQVATRWMEDKETGEFKGCGFVDFVDTAAVDEFVKKNGNVLCGRAVRIDYAESKTTGGGASGDYQEDGADGAW